jgi:hypothetical protein
MLFIVLSLSLPFSTFSHNVENAELGYALTVEEARGSSFGQVLCVLNNDKYSTSQLLYTAMMIATEKFLLLVCVD